MGSQLWLCGQEPKWQEDIQTQKVITYKLKWNLSNIFLLKTSNQCIKRVCVETTDRETVCFELEMNQYSTNQSWKISFNLIQQHKLKKYKRASQLLNILDLLPGQESEEFEKHSSRNRDQMKCKNLTQKAKNFS